MAITHYVWDRLNDTLVEESDDLGNKTTDSDEPSQYGPLISQTLNGITTYPHYDGMGNVTALTDENGDVTDRFTYNAFG